MFMMNEKITQIDSMKRPDLIVGVIQAIESLSLGATWLLISPTKVSFDTPQLYAENDSDHFTNAASIITYEYHHL